MATVSRLDRIDDTPIFAHSLARRARTSTLALGLESERPPVLGTTDDRAGMPPSQRRSDMIAPRVCSLHSTTNERSNLSDRSLRQASTRRSGGVLVDEERKLAVPGEVPPAGLCCTGGVCREEQRGRSVRQLEPWRGGCLRTFAATCVVLIQSAVAGVRPCARDAARWQVTARWGAGACHEVRGRLAMSTVSAEGRRPHVSAPNSACRCSQPAAEGSRRPSDLR
jgi:hypothetical protein